MPGNKTSLEVSNGLRLMVAGGGTGGHLFPGIAIAEEVLDRGPENEVRFVGTGNPFETAVLGARGFLQELIKVQGLKGRGLLRQASALMQIPGSIGRSVAILRRFRPQLVLGLGGYSSGPVVVAARLLGIPAVLHEQNVLPGITNRLLAALAERIYVSFEDTRFGKFREKMRLTGNPVRKEFLRRLENQAVAGEEQPGPERRLFTVLIVGGSQGAHGINKAVVESLHHLKNGSSYAFIHQTGGADEAWVKAAYARQGIVCTVRPFFDDMVTQYRRADMVVCRAGATTIAELTVMGKGVIFIPYPYAANDHQALNAACLVSRQAAEMIREADLDGRLLAHKIEEFAAAPGKLGEMAANARKLGRPAAARTIVDDMYRLAGIDVSRIQGFGRVGEPFNHTAV